MKPWRYIDLTHRVVVRPPTDANELVLVLEPKGSGLVKKITEGIPSKPRPKTLEEQWGEGMRRLFESAVISCFVPTLSTGLPDWQTSRKIVFSDAVGIDFGEEGGPERKFERKQAEEMGEELFEWMEQVRKAVATHFIKQGVAVSHQATTSGTQSDLCELLGDLLRRHGFKQRGPIVDNADVGGITTYVKRHRIGLTVNQLTLTQQTLAKMLIRHLERTKPADKKRN